MLNLSRGDPHGQRLVAGRGDFDAAGTDMISGFQTRRSMQSRRSENNSRHSLSSFHGDRQGLIRAYDEEEAAGFGLTDLADSEDDDRHLNGANGSNGTANGSANGKKQYTSSDIELQSRKDADR